MRITGARLIKIDAIKKNEKRKSVIKEITTIKGTITITKGIVN
jgi:hypothetical protein